MSHLKNIAIVGAGGQVGTYVTNALLGTGKHTVTAITRAGSENPIPSGCKTATITYDDHASIVKALKGQDCLVISLAVTAPPDTSKKLFKAAAEAGVPWVIPNEWGGDSSDVKNSQIFLGQNDQRKAINDLGMSWIGIACSFWYEFSLGGTKDRYGFDMNNKTVVFFDDGEQKIHTSTFPQCGRAVAALLSLPLTKPDASYTGKTLEDYRNKFVHISSFYVSQKDMFASLLRVTGGKESDWEISYEPSKERYEKAGEAAKKGDIVAFGRMMYARGFFPGDDCPLDFSRYGLDNADLGLPQEDLDEFGKKAWEMGTSDYFEKKYAALYKKDAGTRSNIITDTMTTSGKA